MTAGDPAAISVVMPTYRRERVLLDSIGFLLALQEPPGEILVIDQSESHEPLTTQELAGLDSSGSIRWIRRGKPSIPAAMNQGLLEARNGIVLFLDDDIRPVESLVAAHSQAHLTHAGALIAGRVLQPWDTAEEARGDGPFRFSSTQGQWIREFMGGNFSVDRAMAISLGGFDENFVRVAYRFEAEFAHRWQARGLQIWFQPAACLHHLKAVAGGTRTFGEHLTTWKPDHAVGAYYHALRTRNLREFSSRPWRSIATRFHASRPWRIPSTLAGELGGMLWSLALFARGPKYIADAPPGPT